MTRDIAALAKSQRQLAVIPRPICKLAIAGKGKTGAFISDNPMDDPVIAAINQNVRNGFTQFKALGNCQKMVLAFGCRVFDQIIIGQLLRARENGSGDFDRHRRRRTYGQVSEVRYACRPDVRQASHAP